MLKATLLAAVYQQRESTLRRVATLSDAQWDRICPPPRAPRGVIRLDVPQRRVRDIVAHLITVDETALRGGTLRTWAGIRRLESDGGWDPARIADLANRPVTELVTMLARRGELFAKVAAAAPSAVGHIPVRGPYGRQPMLQIVARRVLHEWLHERDIAGSGGPQGHRLPSVEVAEVVADSVLAGIPNVALPRADRDRGVVRLLVDVADGGRLEDTVPGRRTWGVNFGRHQYGPRVLTPPDATIWTTASALALVANGRAFWADDHAPVKVVGDGRLAGALLDAIAIPDLESPLQPEQAPLAAC